MVSGADVRVALQAGLWKALVGSGDRAAMRSSCSDARAMADMLHDTVVLPVGPFTLDYAASVAAYHCKLGAVRALHVRYGASGAEEPHAVRFMEAYSAALGPALPATHCRVYVPAGWHLPTPFVVLLLQRLVPDVERLDMSLGRYHDNLAQLLHALEPCTRMRTLRLLPPPSQHGTATTVRQAHPGACLVSLELQPGVLGALCKLTSLHTLSGPWLIDHRQLQRLCDALPDLTTLGFLQLVLPEHGPYTCISRQLHTLAAWCDGTHARAPGIFNVSAMAAALPAVQQLKGVGLNIDLETPEDIPVVRGVVQRFAACAHEWVLDMWPEHRAQRVLQRLPAGCLAPLQHLDLTMGTHASSASDAAAVLRCLLPAAPNLATVVLRVDEPGYGWGCADLVAMVPPLRQAAHLHTLRLRALNADETPDQQAAALETVVRCLAQPGAEGEGAHCFALRRVLLMNASPDVLDACRRALARDGIAVAVDTCEA